MSGADPLRSAVVTGAAGGIGRAVAARLSADGFAVTLLDLPRSADALRGVEDGLRASGGTGAQPVRSDHVDVTDQDDVERAFQAHAEAFGGLDVVVANAGIAVTAPLLETTAQQWDTTLAVNVRGVASCYRSGARIMIDQGRGGRLIGAASVAAHRAGRWQSAYSASKFAVRGLTQAVALELAEHQITANCYSPGVVQTPMWDGIDASLAQRTGAERGSSMAAMTGQIALGRLQTPDDVAGVVSFLASPDSAYITGQSVVVDGGMWFS
ncbi:SDR family oxidoreductase [Quadrisphaera setariae]|uniref:SDR family oxidoreductase n=1 Tax=Quadrisphaera setariae TaxID=2593304 RepID=A0A5C8ZB89_9ACTN|nr:SDR family oxidoreductase [Quadrisphaera setariae]TXR55027.1 SDR family oxidoreductase [Quadrisphaera setariae]